MTTPTFVTGRVEVSVPATSANLGPGYDSLGLALDLRDRITVETRGSGLAIDVVGAGAGEVPRDADHLVYKAMVRAFEVMGSGVPGLSLRCENVIPHGRGLGSSSAAIVAGICAARGLVAGGSLLLDDDTAFALAADIEGHPDNVAPAFFGGLTIAYRQDERFRSATGVVDPRVRIVVFVPPHPVETEVARGLLPGTVPHAAAAANAGRAALLVAALNGKPELLFAATEDRIHQDYREAVLPQTLRLVNELRADAVAAVVSGAGPTVLAFTDASNQPSLAARAPEGWQAMSLPVDVDGARVRMSG